MEEAVSRMRRAGVSLEQSLASRNWQGIKDDGVYVVFFTSGKNKHVVGGAVPGGNKWLYDASVSADAVSLQSLEARWGPVTGIYQVLP